MVGIVRLVLYSQRAPIKSRVLHSTISHGGAITETPSLREITSKGVQPTVPIDSNCIPAKNFDVDGPSCPRLEGDNNRTCCFTSFPSVQNYRLQKMLGQPSPDDDFHNGLLESLRAELAFYLENTRWKIIENSQKVVGYIQLIKEAAGDLFENTKFVESLELPSSILNHTENNEQVLQLPAYQFDLVCIGQSNESEEIGEHRVHARLSLTSYGDNSGERKLTIEILKDNNEEATSS